MASLGLTLLAGRAEAALGGQAQTVDADRAHFAARMVSTVKSAYTTHTLTLPNGGTAQEFVGPDGVVFAVTWRGPGRPDLRQLLGASFEALQSDNAPEARLAAGGRRRRAPLAVDRADLVVRTAGHPGAFWGAAYLPAKLPDGFSLGDLQ